MKTEVDKTVLQKIPIRILLIEDDEKLAKTIEMLLQKEEMPCDIVNCAEEALNVIQTCDYDIILLDLILSESSGYDVIKNLRKTQFAVPIIVISGIQLNEEKINALTSGADDYITKPFNHKELIARIKAIIRRSKGYAGDVIIVRDLCINIANHTTTLKGKPLHLTTKEQAMLELMALRRGTVVNKETFLSHIYSENEEPEIKIIDVFVCRIRNKMADISKDEYIKTSWGRGYLLKE